VQLDGGAGREPPGHAGGRGVGWHFRGSGERSLSTNLPASVVGFDQTVVHFRASENEARSDFEDALRSR
jgi:hypothetical protein